MSIDSSLKVLSFIFWSQFDKRQNLTANFRQTSRLKNHSGIGCRTREQITLIFRKTLHLKSQRCVIEWNTPTSSQFIQSRSINLIAVNLNVSFRVEIPRPNKDYSSCARFIQHKIDSLIFLRRFNGRNVQICTAGSPRPAPLMSPNGFVSLFFPFSPLKKETNIRRV